MSSPQAAAIAIVDNPDLAPPPGYANVLEVTGRRLVFIAGQAALDGDGAVVGTGDFAAQAEQVFKNLQIALAAAGCNAGDLVKLTVFLRDMADLPTYRLARDRFLATATPPARPTVTLLEVSRLFADELLIEIEAIAAQ